MRFTAKIRARVAKAKLISTGGELNDSSVVLCIYSARLDPAKVTALLGCKPTRAHAKGYIRRPPHGSGPAPIGLWCREAPTSLTFEDKVQFLLDATTARTATWRRLAKSHDVQLRCSIFLHAWSEGFELSGRPIAALGARGWKLRVSIYGAEGEEIVDAFLGKARRNRASRPNNAVYPAHSAVTALAQGGKRRGAGRAGYS